MITTPTVLVLGAGASLDFGYPLGQKLKDNITRGTEADDNLYSSLIRIGHPPKSIKAFHNALFRAGRSSIDAFLEHRARDFILIGKQAIAASLLLLQQDKNLFPSTSPVTGENNWYQYLFEKMNTGFDSFHLNKIAFVTFNYDRSLEHYLFESLKNLYGKSDPEVAAVLQKIPIIHVHGQLGNLPWQKNTRNGPYIPYVKTTDEGHIVNAASGIQIVSEQEDVTANFAPAIRELQSAQRIIFLGFGYNSTNLARLSLDHTSTTFFSGSAYKFTHREINDLAGDSAGLFNGKVVKLHNAKVLQFLRENITL